MSDRVVDRVSDEALLAEVKRSAVFFVPNDADMPVMLICNGVLTKFPKDSDKAIKSFFNITGRMARSLERRCVIDDNRAWGIKWYIALAFFLHGKSNAILKGRGTIIFIPRTIGRPAMIWQAGKWLPRHTWEKAGGVLKVLACALNRRKSKGSVKIDAEDLIIPVGTNRGGQGDIKHVNYLASQVI